MAGRRQGDRRNPPAENNQRDAPQDERTEACIAGPRVLLGVLNIFPVCALLGFSGVGPLKNGGRIRRGRFPLNDVLLLAVYLNRTHGELTSTRGGR